MKIIICVILLFFCETRLIVFGEEITPTPLVNRPQSSDKTPKAISDNDIIAEHLIEIISDCNPDKINRFRTEARGPINKSIMGIFFGGLR